MAKIRKKKTQAERRKWLNKKHKKHDEQFAGSAKVVADCMRSVGRKGNPRDFVIISGASIMDFWGPVPIPEAVDSRVMLVSKAKLEALLAEKLKAEGLAEKIADHFWNKTTNRRRNRSPKKGSSNAKPENSVRMED